MDQEEAGLWMDGEAFGQIRGTDRSRKKGFKTSSGCLSPWGSLPLRAECPTGL